jgi:hypothetical protein
MVANTDYLGVLAQVIGCVREAMRDSRLSELTPEEVTDWLHSMTIEDVRAVWNVKDVSKRHLSDE